MAVFSRLLFEVVRVIIVLHLKLVKSGTQLLMVNSQVVDFALVFRYGHQKLRISNLTSQESVNDFVDVRESRSSSDFLEGVLNIVVLVHFLLHFLFQEGGEKSLDQELLLHFDLILIFVFVGGHFSNLLLSLDPDHSPLEGFFFISDGFLQTQNSLLSFSLVLIDFHHDLFEFHFGLDSVLLGPPLLLRFFTQNISLRFHALLQVLGLQLGRNEIGLHSLEDMLILSLRQFFEFVLLLQIIKFGFIVSCGALLMRI